MLIIASYVATVIAWLRLRAGEWDEAERLVRREIERAVVVRLLAKTVWPSWPCAGAIRTPPSGWPSSRLRPIAPASCSGSCRSSSSRPSGP